MQLKENEVEFPSSTGILLGNIDSHAILSLHIRCLAREHQSFDVQYLSIADCPRKLIYIDIEVTVVRNPKSVPFLLDETPVVSKHLQAI